MINQLWLEWDQVQEGDELSGIDFRILQRLNGMKLIDISQMAREQQISHLQVIESVEKLNRLGHLDLFWWFDE